MFATSVLAIVFLVLAALLPREALAQFYRPQMVERSDEVVRLEIERGFDGFGERRSLSKKEQERQAGAWKMYGRLGIVNVANDDGVTFRGGGPKLGRLTFGIRKRF